ARRPDRIRAEDAARGIDREVRAEALLAAIDDAPALSDVAEAEVLEPHRLEPRERHVDLRRLDLAPRLAAPGAIQTLLRADPAGHRVHLIATWDPHRLGVGGGRLDPRGTPRSLARLLLRGEDERAGAVGRRTGLEVADRIPEDGRIHDVLDRHRLPQVRV